MGYLESLTKHALRASIRPDGKLRIEPDWLITDDIRRMVFEHRGELVGEIMRNATGSSSAETAPDYRILMVATNLDSWEADDPRFGYEIDCDPVYRMLDAPYYAWLRHRIENARDAHGSGNLDNATYDVLRERFNIIHNWAIRNIGEDALRRAVRTTNVKSYTPPSLETFAAYRKTWDDAWNACQRRIAAQSDQARRLEHALATRGFAGIKSSVIDDIVVFVRDDSVSVPDKWADRVRFTMDELGLLAGSPQEVVKQVYDVKRALGGTVVPADGA